MLAEWDCNGLQQNSCIRVSEYVWGYEKCFLGAQNIVKCNGAATDSEEPRRPLEIVSFTSSRFIKIPPKHKALPSDSNYSLSLHMSSVTCNWWPAFRHFHFMWPADLSSSQFRESKNTCHIWSGTLPGGLEGLKSFPGAAVMMNLRFDEIFQAAAAINMFHSHSGKQIRKFLPGLFCLKDGISG